MCFQLAKCLQINPSFPTASAAATLDSSSRHSLAHEADIFVPNSPQIPHTIPAIVDVQESFRPAAPKKIHSSLFPPLIFCPTLVLPLVFDRVLVSCPTVRFSVFPHVFASYLQWGFARMCTHAVYVQSVCVCWGGGAHPSKSIYKTRGL